VRREPVAGEAVLYREVVYYQAWMYALMVGIIGLYAAILVGAAMEGMRLDAALYAVVALALGLVLANFRRLEFVITEGYVVFGFGVIKKRFPRDRVISCEPCELTFANYLGYGIRWGRDRTVAYNTRNGPGVRLTVEGQKKPYVVSLGNPGIVCSILQAGGSS